MDDYIKLSMAVKAFMNAEELYDPEWGNKRFSLTDVEKILNSVAPADVRPVVLCRDCDYWNEWDHVGRETLGNFRCSCAYWSNEDGPICYTGGNDFCSYGERREGGTP